jgi:hypothetical protein
LNRLVFAALAASLLASCAHHRFEHGYRYMDPTRPMVNVVGGQFVVVNQEPLVFLRDQRDVVINWQLPPGANLRFPRDGVAIEKAGDEFVNCAVRDGGQSFSCTNRHTKPGKYSYTIRVQAGDRILQSDPFIMNQ